MADRTYYDFDPETRSRIERCADQITLIRNLEERGYPHEALELTQLTLEASRQIHRRALMPWGAITEGLVSGVIIPGSGPEKLWNMMLGASMGWLVGHARHVSAVDDLEYLIDALDEHSHRLRAMLATDTTPQDAPSSPSGSTTPQDDSDPSSKASTDAARTTGKAKASTPKASTTKTKATKAKTGTHKAHDAKTKAKSTTTGAGKKGAQKSGNATKTSSKAKVKETTPEGVKAVSDPTEPQDPQPSDHDTTSTAAESS
ncbi:MAG: hypothetical protein AAFS10_02490 [Myxococcota bacterium]